MIAAVVFDFDGTLFDTSDAIYESFNGALAAAGRPPMPVAEIRAMIGRPLIEMFAVEDPGATPPQIERRIEDYRAIFLPVCVQRTRPLPGAVQCLEQLRGRCRLAIATNRKTDGARCILDGFGLGGIFDVVVGIEDVRRTKPDPEAVQLALTRLAARAADAVYVGDTPEDMRAARAAEVRAIGVPTGSHSAPALAAAGAERVLASLAELPALLFVA